MHQQTKHSLTAIRQRRQEHMDACDEILSRCKKEGRDPNTLEKRTFDKQMKSIDRIDAYDLPTAERRFKNVNRGTKMDQPETQLTTMGLGEDYRGTSIVGRHQPVRNFIQAEIGGKKPAERAYEFGHWALASIDTHCPSMHGRFAQSQAIVQERGLDVYNVASTTDNANAGVFVPEQFGQDLIILRENYGKLRQVAEVVPMSSDTRVDPKWTSGLTASFTTENAAASESDATWENVKLVAKDLTVLSRMSNQLSADSAISYGDALIKEIAYAMALKEDTVGFNGTGIGSDGGIIGIRTRLTDIDGAGANSFGLNSQAAGNTWGAMVIGDFHDTIGLCPEYSLVRDPIWICNTLFYHTVLAPLAVAQAGGATVAEIGRVVGGADIVRTFLGFPVIFSQVYPSATAVSTVAISFGDHSLGVRLGDRQQEAVMFSEHASVGGESVFERNQIAVRATARLDIVVHGYGTSAVAGPIVGLQTGS